MTRRCLLSLPALAAARPAYRPRLAVQLYVWSQHFRARNVEMAKGMEECLAATSRAGFKLLEFDGQYLAPPMGDSVRALLKKYSLRVPILYRGGVMYDAEAAAKTLKDLLETAALAKKAGAVAINTNPSPKPQRGRKSDQELAVEAETLNRLGGELSRRGLRLQVHQHDPEMREEAREWRYWLRHTDPKHVFFCLDLDWVHRGGQDPMTLLREAGPRVASLHIRSARNRVWQESLGEGDVDYAQVAAYLRQTGFTGYLVVELAYEKQTPITRSLEENLKLSREYAEKVFLRS